MKWIALLLGLFLFASGLHAGGPDDQYVELYNLIQQADSMTGDNPKEAANRYLQAQTMLKQMQTLYPAWNRDVVKFRVEYVAEKLESLAQYLPAPAKPAQPAKPAAPAKLDAAELQQQMTALQQQVRNLEGQKTVLEKKLKEALSIQPAAVDSKELARAEAKILELQKERDLLAVTVEQDKAARAALSNSPKASDNEEKLKAELVALTKQLSDLQAKHDADKATWEKKLQQTSTAKSAPKADKNARAVNKKLKAELAAVTQELAEVRAKFEDEKASWEKKLEQASTPQPAPDKEELAKAEAKILELKKERDLLAASLEKEKAARIADSSTPKPSTDDAEIKKLKDEVAALIKQLADTEAKGDEQLLAAQAEVRQLKKAAENQEGLARQLSEARARLAVLEAPAIPYTEEELAIMKKGKQEAPVVAAGAPVQVTNSLVATAGNSDAPKSDTPKRAVRSMKDLPPGAGTLMAEAQRAFRMRDYERAEKKFGEVLQQDEKNVFVLGHLAMTQFAAGQTDACEKTVARTLALDPDDAACLYLLGNLRLQQNKLEDALNALSRSAEMNPTNAATQNSLGSVLGQKGMMKQAETALRKALQLDPEYRDAHFNLALVYAMQKPASIELARWHYKKALDMGRPKSAELDELLK